MAFGGDAPSAITTMWILTALTFVFVVARMYTRIRVTHSHGIDDHVYNLAFALLLIYVIFVTLSSTYGFGQSRDAILSPDDAIAAVLFEAVGQSFAVVGMAVAKWSLGLFLLRLVTKAWHRITIWATMSVLMAASVSVVFVFWLQCTPPAYLFDKTIQGGYCAIDSTPVSMLLCILCVLVDFFFALFPWLFIWSLQMNKREKLVILASMSLGVIAGACGIKRTMEVPELSSPNYLKDTVGLIVWSTAEIAVTMICIGIPICRPLYKTFLETLSSRLSSHGLSTNSKNHNSRSRRHSRVYAMHTFAAVDTNESNKQFGHALSTRDLEEDRDMSNETIRAGRRASDEGSDEGVLRSTAERSDISGHGDFYGKGIRVTEEYQVTSSLRRHR
ncbi:hypothetical protein BKA67DRAFT_539582 [Truncatella angustata]|uniref:Rhodopsin domain-containing protein n=1 Tax=Truncatella angustata TaxID=152316 RepID=A0A9P8UAU1_9PEZI|nr:uncharacterized protein BKA67DRAFT_539582 [Truncatella angustata]KAH6647736.1 hypothetical protein BKA67DRAFT_539582 [Truncatella angustata]